MENILKKIQLFDLMVKGQGPHYYTRYSTISYYI